ncbi:MAG: hypothetical protein P4L28_09920 [Paludibacteraceae bacterium]|nr:hypothetical protein [Paludibacteraceae bacterium]
MKKHFLLAIAALLMAFSFMSCKKMGPLATDYFKVDPPVLEAKAGKVEATITGTFPEKYFKKKATVTITPVLKYNGTEEKLQTVAFQGENAKGNNKKVKYQSGGTYTHRVSFDFKPGMEKSELYLQFEVQEGSKSKSLPEVKIADGINCTYMLAKAENLDPAFASDQFQRSITNQQEADIKFLINKADIRSTELKKDELLALTNKLKEATSNQGSTIKDVEISGYASPEGSLNTNTSLAEKREKTAVEYINKQMSKFKAKAQVDSKYTAEDWDGFQKLVSQSSIQDKELILSVLSQFSDPDQRETEIRKLSAAFKVLATDVLPQLRRSKLKVSYEISGKTDEQLLAAAKSNPSSLSVEELLFTATLTTDVNTKADIYAKAAELFPNDWRTINNLGAAKYLQGNTAEAEKLFSKAFDMNSSAKETNFNWGVVQLKKGDVKLAEQFLGKCAGMGAKLDGALGIIYLYKGDYAAANKALAEDKTNNAVIAKLVVKDVASATTILKQVKNPNALTSYLKAIVAARTADKEGVFSNLKDAAKDPELKKRAGVDIEFAKYNTDPAFSGIVK